MTREATFILPTLTVKQEMIQHICAINRHLTPEYLEDFDIDILMNDCHPIYREYFQERIKKGNKVN